MSISEPFHEGLPYSPSVMHRLRTVLRASKRYPGSAFVACSEVINGGIIAIVRLPGIAAHITACTAASPQIERIFNMVIGAAKPASHLKRIFRHAA
jgi:hypothetical protein